MRAPSTDSPSEGISAGLRYGLPISERPTVAQVNLEALSHNYAEVVRHAEGRNILAVVKAGAYGHGSIPVSRRLLDLGADMLGVALVEEARELRAAGIHAPILVMGIEFPEQAEAIIALKLTPVISTMSFAHALSAVAGKSKLKVPVHVKIDTGMGRIGIPPEDAADFIASIGRLPGIDVQGLMTHFADADLCDKDYASKQIDRFELLMEKLSAWGMTIPVRHAANSAAILDYRRALFTMVRPGLMLYGYNPLEAKVEKADLRPVLSLVTRIAFLKKVQSGVPISYGRTFVTKRESLIATLPIGYADGYSRRLSNVGEAIVRGVRVPVVGRVCMDMCMIDVTDVPGTIEGDPVALIGNQASEKITADDIAQKTGTIAYEVLCGISSRVPRIYL
jgi:alanine racemase